MTMLEQEEGEVAEEIKPPVDEQKQETVPPVEEKKEGEQEEQQVDDSPIAQINNMHGFEIPVEYSEGTDPLSVQGLYERELALRELTEVSVYEHIKATKPDVYRLMLHMENGGTLADFDKSITVPSWDELKDNLDRQKQVYTQWLKSKGVDDEDAIEAAIQSAIKKGDLDKKVQKYIEEEDKKAKKSVDDLEAEQNRIFQETENDYRILDSVLNNIYGTNSFPNIRIPDTKKPDSYDNFVQSVKRDENNRTFSYVVPITDENIAMLVQLDYIRNNPDSFKKTATVNKQQQALDIKNRNKEAEQVKTVASNNESEDRVSLARYISR